ncbi:energy transducer TonB [Hymenobacter yonginensis]|uniref:TonB family protein n=1 Tax=Hymenobacter yonginensis TaxID=748197 RepID=A0ABY7PKV9_9BACT|nr:energy transducer TonB [Hymenobacter yonginensis]WBO83878.1 TonB family protein [Hymenobacter yonginensis]
MLPLPILDVRLQPCSENWQQMTPTAQGRHCASCQRTVFDFTDKTSADLEAARAASPDGRLCGRFRPTQLAHPPRLRPRLRRFLVALVLVCGLGLTSQQAIGQFLACAKPPTIDFQSIADATAEALGLEPVSISRTREYPMTGFITTEPMPVFPGGQDSLVAYMKRNLRYPDSTSDEGKVFISFVITKTGHIAQAKVLKGVTPTLNAEALRVVRQMPRWIQLSRQHPIEVSYTLPITFSQK